MRRFMQTGGMNEQASEQFGPELALESQRLRSPDIYTFSTSSLALPPCYSKSMAKFGSCANRSLCLAPSAHFFFLRMVTPTPLVALSLAAASVPLTSSCSASSSANVLFDFAAAAALVAAAGRSRHPSAWTRGHPASGPWRRRFASR